MHDRELRDRAELDRIRSVNRGYFEDPGKRRSWSLTAAHRFELARKWSRILDQLLIGGIEPGSCRFLDLGVSTGTDCTAFLESGFHPDTIVALDLDQRSIRFASLKFPWLRAVVGNAARLPHADQSFDIVYQSTVISSVLNPELRLAIMNEAGRVLRPGGVFISYDMRYPNPWNRHTRPLRTPEIRSAFPGWELSVTSLTGIPQIIRPLSRLSLSLCRLIEMVPLLRSHLLVFARKP